MLYEKDAQFSQNTLTARPIWPELFISLFSLASLGRILPEKKKGNRRPIELGKKKCLLMVFQSYIVNI